ncbi:MAG TPA: hypothetical protein VJR27_05055 [Candidatus Saccharimonadales bacterium]|nr:hypothetical protein [Candidatus Saccharimonadales bacterium]
MPKTSFGPNSTDDSGYDEDWIGGVHHDDSGLESGTASPGDIQAAENDKRGSRLGNSLKYGSDRAAGGEKSLFKNPAAGAAGAGGAAGVAQKLGNALRGNKKRQGGIAALVLSIVLVFFVGGELPHELNAISKTLQREEAKVAQQMEQKLSNKVGAAIVNKALQKGSSASEKAASQADADKAKADGRQVAEAINDLAINENIFQKFMADADLHLQFNGSGDLIDVLDGNGKSVPRNTLSENPDFLKFLDEAWGIDQMEGFRPNMMFDSGTSFNVFPEDGSKDADPKRTLNEAIEKGASAEEIAQAKSETNKTPPDESAPPADKTSFQNTDQNSKVLQDGIDAANKTFEETGDAAKANAAGVKASMSDLDTLNNKLFWAGIATEGCTLEQETVKAADSRVAKILILLARAGLSDIVSLSSELNAGKLSSKTVNTVMKTFQSDPSILTNSDGTKPEAGLPFTRSAAWHRVTGTTVDLNPKSPYYTPDISDAARPTRKAGSNIADGIQKAMNSVGLNYGCAALTSKAGVFIQTGANLVQIVSNLGDFGATQVAVAAGSLALLETFNRVIMPPVIDYFTNTSITGTNPAVQKINNGDAGLDFAYSNWGRRLGGLPQTNDATQVLRDNATKAVVRRENMQPWTYRTFALDNPSSLASKLLMQVPLGTQATLAGIAHWMTSFPFTVAHQIASIFTSPKLFAAGVTSNSGCVDAYCIITHAYGNSVIDQYDSVQNESYLFGNVSYGGKTVRKIDALGNPNTYQDGPSGDSNNDDLLHCFVDPHSMLIYIADGTNDAARKNCGTIGSYDMNFDDPTKWPTMDTIAGIYCKALVGSDTDSSCKSAVTAQMDTKSDNDNELMRYCVYLGTAQVTKTFKSMTKLDAAAQ